MIDFWSLRKGGRWPAGHGRVLKSLLAKAKQGVRVIYIPGNHDEVARDYLGLLVGGVELVAEYEHHTADGRRFLVTHGDELDSAVKCGGWLTGMFGDWMYDVLLFANRWTNRLRRRLNYPYWSLANFLKPRIGQAAAYIARFEAAAAREARHRGFDGVICGHIHQAALRDIGGVCYATMAIGSKAAPRWSSIATAAWKSCTGSMKRHAVGCGQRRRRRNRKWNRRRRRTELLRCRLRHRTEKRI